MLWLHEHQIDGADDEQERQDVIPVEVVALEHDIGHDSEHSQRDALLYDLQLHQVEGSTIVNESQPIGRHLATVFEEGDAPREGDDAQQRPVARHARLLQTQMTIPGKRHENIAQNEQDDGVKSIHILLTRKCCSKTVAKVIIIRETAKESVCFFLVFMPRIAIHGL